MPDQETMQEWQKLAQPGKQHESLARHAGEWNVKMRARMSPNDPWGDGQGTVTIRALLGGRVITEEMHAHFGEMPFEGFGTMGYDNFKQKYWQTWTDWMTSLFCAEGAASSDGKTLTFNGKMDHPETGRTNVDMRTVYQLIDSNHYIFEMYTRGPDGKEFKGLEAEYRRK